MSSKVVRFYLFGELIQISFDSEERAKFFQQNIDNLLGTNKTPLSSAISLYISKISCNKHKRSQSGDLKTLTDLEMFLELQFKVLYIYDIKLSHLEEFRNQLKSLGLKPSTVNRKFNTIKHFFNTCMMWEFIDKNPCLHIKTLTTSFVGRTVWSHDDYSLVRSHLSSLDRVFLDILYETGIRLSSLQRLNKNDINLTDCSIIVRTKKGNLSCEKIYTSYLSQSLTKKLYTSIDHKPHSDYLAKKIIKAIQQAGLKHKNLTCHGLRHTFARRMYEKKLSLHEISKLLGHSSLKVTDEYLKSLNIDPDNIRKKLFS